MNFTNKLNKISLKLCSIRMTSFTHLNKCQTNKVFVRNVRSYMKKDVLEPQYLDYLKPQIPYYPLLNIQLRGYDFVVLENYAKYLHNLSNKLGINSVKFWCSPHNSLKYDLLKPESEVSESQFVLNLYERNIQIENLSAKMTPILLEILMNSVPEGITVALHEHNPTLHEESRFIPDLQLDQFKAELQEIKGQMSVDIEEPKVKPKK